MTEMAGRLLTDEQLAFFVEHNPGRSAAEMAQLMNDTFGLQLTESQVHAFKKNHKLRSGSQYRGKTKLFTPEQEAFFYEHNKGTLAQDLVDLMNAEFGTCFTAGQIRAFRKNHHASSGLVMQFGHGQKMYHPKKGEVMPGSEKTWFKKGHRPHNWKPVGSERVNSDGYIEVKIAEPRTWAFKHKLVYEEHFGPIPEGSVIRFLDGNRLNCSPDNLVLLTKAEHAVLTRKGLATEDPELTRAGVNAVKLSMKIKELEEE